MQRGVHGGGCLQRENRMESLEMTAQSVSVCVCVFVPFSLIKLLHYSFPLPSTLSLNPIHTAGMIHWCGGGSKSQEGDIKFVDFITPFPNYFRCPLLLNTTLFENVNLHGLLRATNAQLHLNTKAATKTP